MYIAAMYHRTIFIAVIITVIGMIKANNNTYKLEFVQLMYRHGDRAPEGLYPTDPNPREKWPLGLGSLTKLGKKQHYSLGRLFKKMYKGFYTTKPNEVDALSTDVPRCLMSAEANFASFFAPAPKYKFDNDLNWQPIPITSFPLALDKFMGQIPCPALDKALSKQLKTPSNKEFDKQHKELYQYVSKHSGKKIENYSEARDLFDILLCEKQHNLIMPSWVPPVYEKLKDVAAHTYPLMYNSTEIQKLNAGPLLEMLNLMFDFKIDNKIKEVKFRTYSTHDRNIGVMLGVLNNLEVEIVHYCASLIFEMYSGSSGNDYFIRILYLNTENNDKFHQTPKVLTLPGCEEYCPYKKYLEYTKPFATFDYDKACPQKS